MHRNNYFAGTDRKFGLEKEHFGNESLFMQGFGQARMTLGRGGHNELHNKCERSSSLLYTVNDSSNQNSAYIK